MNNQPDIPVAHWSVATLEVMPVMPRVLLNLNERYPYYQTDSDSYKLFMDMLLLPKNVSE